ncbi:TIGR03503 family protein [Pseudoalteromonas xiamenensis]|uniref:TIGR03503 family protein n=1 Tax=Pseudoalteromonas xiamenensis TaxID=882626 RepID=A0A975HKU1_9GAMM|nr:TIGR03503 family protein [Pseudoalteromonas xiamenensis]QTH71396.1 TIGR03503 family protein [Pseudoalteromonas xiamenensis]
MTLILRVCFFAVLVLVGSFVHAQTDEDTKKYGLTMLKRDGVVNEVPLLNNRFRIDYKVEEITMLFFRRPGAPPVVLVQPDGSKLYPTHAMDNENLDWYDEVSYDLVIIRHPTPGPWQVVGQIQKDSRIMILGDITLDVDPLPPLIFQGETLKVTARVLNDGSPISVGYFRDVVTLYVEFVSTNNDQYDNFGAGTKSVTEFRDNGQDFDERPMDGVFTGEFKLSFPAGEWRPEFSIQTPILKRRVVKAPLVVAEPPFNFNMTLASDGDPSDHLLQIRIDPNVAKPDTVIFQGKIFYPNGEEQLFTLGKETSLYRELSVKNYDWGRYSIEISAFGENINGREFMATLPLYKFEIERPIEKVPEILKPLVETTLEPELPPEPEISTEMMVTIIVLGNMVILLLGWAAVRVFVQNKPLLPKLAMPSMPNLFKKKSLDLDELEIEQSENSDSEQKTNDSGDILNLSMKER